jgi:hypothetical protein
MPTIDDAGMPTKPTRSNSKPLKSNIITWTFSRFKTSVKCITAKLWEIFHNGTQSTGAQ